jgi:hypothetical protein
MLLIVGSFYGEVALTLQRDSCNRRQIGGKKLGWIRGAHVFQKAHHFCKHNEKRPVIHWPRLRGKDLNLRPLGYEGKFRR